MCLHSEKLCDVTPSEAHTDQAPHSGWWFVGWYEVHTHTHTAINIEMFLYMIM
jgi:hypothetical protein